MVAPPTAVHLCISAPFLWTGRYADAPRARQIRPHQVLKVAREALRRSWAEPGHSCGGVVSAVARRFVDDDVGGHHARSVSTLKHSS